MSSDELDEDEDALFKSAVDTQKVQSVTCPANGSDREIPDTISEESEKIGSERELGKSNLFECTKINVVNPEKRVCNKESYVLFQIVSEGGINGTVRRRFNEFRNLHGCLSAEHPYRFIPALPTKGSIIAMDRFASDFVETRRQNLERFLQNVLRHPILSRTKAFTNFLTITTNWSENLPAIQVSASSKAFSALDKISSSISQAFSTRMRDPAFDDMFQYIDLYHDRVGFANRVTHKVLNETADTMHFSQELPAKILQLADLEEDDVLAKMLKEFSKSTEVCSLKYGHVHDYLQEQMIPYFEDQIRYCDEIKLALRSRDKLQFDVETCHENRDNKERVSQRIDERSWEYDSTTKARIEYEANSLKDKEIQLMEQKKIADKLVQNEMAHWNSIKTVEIKKCFRELSEKNITNIADQLSEYEALLSVLKAQ